ncbi:MAG: diacylglycerol/polyprenol kinase family protein [Phycisphaerae bacterium]
MAYRQEIARKTIHLASALIPTAYLFLPRELVLTLLLILLLAMGAIEVLRQNTPAFGRLFDRILGFMLRRFEHRGVTGATFVFLASFLAIGLFPKPIALTVLYILSISDSLASLVGMRFGSIRFRGKSLEGSAAFFLSALLIAWIVFQGRPVPALVGATVSTVAEALPLRLGRYEVNDNVWVPLVTGATLMLVVPSP